MISHQANSMADRWAFLTLLILSFGVQLLTVGEFSSLCDEGFVTTVADRMCNGETLYKDIDCFLPPLIPIFFMVVFKLIGTTIQSATLGLAAIRAANVMLVYWISRQVSGRLSSFIVSCILLFGFSLETIHANYHWAANIPYLTLVALLLHWTQKPRLRWLVAAGFNLGVASLTLHTYSLFGAVLVLFVLYRSGITLTKLRAVALGLVPVLIAFFAILTLQGSLGSGYECLISENSYRIQYEQVSVAQAITFNLNAMSTSPLESASIWLPLLLSIILPFTRPRKPSTTILLLANLLLLASSAYRFLWQNVAIHDLLCFPILAIYLEETQIYKLAVGLSLVLCLPQASNRLSSLMVERHWVDFPRGQVFVSSEFEASKLNELREFLLKRAKPGQQALLLAYVPNLHFLMGYRNPNPVIILRPISVPREKYETAVERLAHAWVFRFQTYDSPQFLLAFWPNCDMKKYSSDNQWFHDQLVKTHEFKDWGAVLVYRPLETEEPSK